MVEGRVAVRQMRGGVVVSQPLQLGFHMGVHDDAAQLRRVEIVAAFQRNQGYLDRHGARFRTLDDTQHHVIDCPHGAGPYERRVRNVDEIKKAMLQHIARRPSEQHKRRWIYVEDRTIRIQKHDRVARSRYHLGRSTLILKILRCH